MTAVSCKACPLRKQPLFAPFSSEDLAFMQRFKAGEMTVEPGTPILLEGSNAPQLFTVLKGMGLRYKTLENGNRQVINFVFPGDFIGLQAGVMGEMQHSVEATTPMMLCAFNRKDVWQLYRNSPERAFDLTWLAALEEHLLGETVATLGQRDASQRIAWAILKFHSRIKAVGLGRNGSVPFPFKQQDLADALGLSLVHTNKTLAQFRKRQLASWSDGNLTITAEETLARVAMIDTDKPETRPLM